MQILCCCTSVDFSGIFTPLEYTHDICTQISAVLSTSSYTGKNTLVTFVFKRVEKLKVLLKVIHVLLQLLLPLQVELLE